MSLVLVNDIVLEHRDVFIYKHSWYDPLQIEYFLKGFVYLWAHVCSSTLNTNFYLFSSFLLIEFL